MSRRFPACTEPIATASRRSSSMRRSSTAPEPGARAPYASTATELSRSVSSSRGRSRRVDRRRGMSLAPGFIDTHSHHDEGLFEMRDAAPVMSQGITTIVVGQDGSMTYPVKELVRAHAGDADRHQRCDLRRSRQCPRRRSWVRTSGGMRHRTKSRACGHSSARAWRPAPSVSPRASNTTRASTPTPTR